MPRKSSASLSVVAPEPPLNLPRPSSDAPANVAEIFAELLANAPREHFRSGDAALIEAYAQAISLSRQAWSELSTNGPVIDGRPSAWITVLEKAHRSLVALAARLRLAPQSRADSRSTARAAGPRPSIYELIDDE